MNKTRAFAQPRFILAGLLLIFCLQQAAAQNISSNALCPPPAGAQLCNPDAPLPQRPLLVGIHSNAPFVMEDTENPSGMAIELWEAAAAQLGLNFSYRPYATISELLQAAETGSVDIAVTNLAVSSGRLRRLDLTQPWYDSGMRIMIKENRGATLRRVFERLSKSGHLYAYLWFGGFLLLATLVLTVLDRRYDKDFTRNWTEGLAENFYHVVSATSTGRANHKPMFGALGRLFSALWLLSAIGFITYVSSSIASTMTAVSLTSDISGHADLGKGTVGVQSGSVGEAYAQMMALDIRRYSDTTAAIQDLLEERIDAVLDDAPVLEYYDTTHPTVPITVVGGIIKPEKYAFMLTRGSPAMRPLSALLAEYRENGFLEKLNTKYFGATR